MTSTEIAKSLISAKELSEERMDRVNKPFKSELLLFKRAT